ncbi:segregation/condensation protein A, partial [Staphylococcus epidermidis]|uniref:segregation/condensation protein A n=1 Tax=Staphylococcus epidermidis TaxID=1282 RepID=UPI0037DA3BE4
MYHIPIKPLTQHYIQYLHPINHLQINLPTQYLLIPSQLLIIRTKLLFPQTTIQQHIEHHPPHHLLRTLIHYQNYKQYTQILNTMKRQPDLYFTK